MSQEFCRDVPDPWRCSRSLCKKTSCAFFVPQISASSHPELGSYHWQERLDVKVPIAALCQSTEPRPNPTQHPKTRQKSAQIRPKQTELDRSGPRNGWDGGEGFAGWGAGVKIWQKFG